MYAIITLNEVEKSVSMNNINYRISVKIRKEINVVLSSLFDYEQLKMYQEPPLIMYHQMRGNKLENGSVVRLFYNYNGIKIYMDEYIIENELPNHITLLYTIGDIKNRMKYSFTKVDENHTLWTNEVIFEFPSGFEYNKLYYMKQTEEDMKAFKEYLEHD